MGSPLFGRIIVRGAQANTKGRSFGEAMAFSPDSRLLAVEEFVGVAPDGTPRTRAVVFDLRDESETVVHEQDPGFIRRLWWEADGALSFVAWSHLGGEFERRAAWRPEGRS